MNHILHRHDPAGITAPKAYQVADNINVLDWLTSTFPDQSDLCGELACSFWLNGKEIFRNDHKNLDESLLDFTLGKDDQLVIVNRPAGFFETAYLIIAAISAAAAIITYMNMPKLPGAEDARNESPNNRLNAASNEFRPGQGIPQCFGYGVAYPDFVQLSYYFYENNIKKQVGLFVISEGSVLVDQVRVGETDINDIPESTAIIYQPSSLPPAEFTTTHETATNVDGQILYAADDSNISKELGAFTITTNGTSNFITIPLEALRDFALTTAGYLYIRSSHTGGTIQALNGVYPVIDIVESGTNAIIEVAGNYTDTPNVAGTVGRGYKDGVIGDGFAGELDYWVGWFDTPGELAEEQWVHWQAPVGVRKKGGGSLTLTVRIEVRNKATDVTIFKDVSITKNTLDPQFVTTYFEKSEFPSLTPGQYQIRMRRLTNVIDKDGGASEQLKAEAFVSVTPYSAANFGDVTCMLVQRKANVFGPDQAGQKINVDYRRQLPHYNRTTGIYDVNDLRPTDAFADAAAYTLIVSGQETPQSVNLAEKYEIYDNLSDPRLGSFTFTFDDADLSKGERVESICNAARVVSFHDGVQWRFNRDEAKPIRSALFSRRSVPGNQATQSWQPQRNDDADSVRIIYVDPDSNTEAFAERSFDLNTGAIIADQIGVVPIEIKLAGCRDAYQAANRADLEIRRVAYQRKSVSFTAYRDALDIDLLDRVDWVDINDVDTFDGEIFGVNVSTFDTSERFIPTDGKAYVVFITDNDGYPSNTVPCTPRTDTEFGFIASGLSGAYVASGLEQVGSRYFIADADDLAASTFTLKSRTPTDGGKVEVELVEYVPAMYERDSALAPDQSPILNNGLIALNVEQVGTDSISVLTLNDNGTISLNGVSALWYGGGTTPAIGAQFEAYATLVSGTLASGTLNQWLPITGQSWSVLRSGADGVSDAVIALTIRQINYPENNASNQLTIRSVIAAPVALPAVIDIETNAPANFGQAILEFLSNGAWRGTDGDVGTYTTEVAGLGYLYEAQATNLVGVIDGGAVNTWLNLGGSGASWVLNATTTETVTFDLEVREAANISNNAMTAVTMTVNVPV